MQTHQIQDVPLVMISKSEKSNLTNLLLLSVILILSSWACEEPPPPKPKPLPTHRVVLNEGTNMAVAISPNLQTLIIDLQGTLWMLPVQGGKAEPITDPLNGCHLPDWSPNSQQIAFHSYKDGNFHIWLIKPDGTELQQLTQGNFDYREPNWSPDGRHIVCSSDRGGSYNLWEVDVQNGDMKQLTSDPGQEAYPVWSSDGRKLAWSDPQRGIFWMEKEGSPTQISEGESTFGAPSWMPGDTALVYCIIQNGKTQWQKTSIETGETSLLPHKEADIFPFRAEWLSNTEMLYTANGKICRKQLDQDTFKTIEFQIEIPFFRKPWDRKTYDFNNLEKQAVKGIRSPILSPDGKQIAFTALGDLWVKDLEGEIRKITDDPFLDIDPYWSPDGEKIVFASDRRGKMDLWIYTISTERFRQLTWTDGDVIYPSWSPDGEQIACFETDRMNQWGRGRLQLVDLVKDQINDQSVELFEPGMPVWTPDGKRLAIAALNPYSARFREGINQIRIIEPGEKTPHFLKIGKGKALTLRGRNGPIWSPDGKQIAYIQDGSLWVQGISSDFSLLANPLRVTDELASDPNWTPDGKSLIYLAGGKLKRIDLDSGRDTELPISLEWSPEAPEKKFMIIHAGKLFDGKKDSYQENVDIFIQGNRITDIKPHADHPADIELIDASRNTVLPGLFDMHVHQSAVAGEKLGRRWLAFGVTSVRETGANPYDALERYESWTSGKRPGPRHFFTGPLMDGSRVYYALSNPVSDTFQLKKEVDFAQKMGYDLVKTYVRLPDADQKQFILQAHAHGLPVYSHELYPAVVYGIDGVEHMTGTSRRGYSLKHSVIRNSYQDVRVLLVQSGMTITPTIGLSGGVYTLFDEHPEILRHPVYRDLFSRNYRNQFEDRLRTRRREGLEGTKQLVSNQQTFLKKLVQSEGKIVAGTDTPFLPEGWSLHVELQLYVQSGLTPAQALMSATSQAAKAAGVGNDLGSIESGKLADLFIVKGDPLQHISEAWNVDRVIKNGKIYTIRDLTR